MRHTQLVPGRKPGNEAHNLSPVESLGTRHTQFVPGGKPGNEAHNLSPVESLGTRHTDGCVSVYSEHFQQKGKYMYVQEFLSLLT